MLPTVLDVVNSVISVGEGHDLGEKKLNGIKRLHYSEIESIIIMINNQPPLMKRKHALYQMRLADLDFELLSYIDNDLGDIDHTTLDITDSLILLNALSPNYLVEYLNHNPSNYTILPFSYGCSAKDSYHRASLLFIRDQNEVYLVDPNGHPNYFDNVLGLDTVTAVERVFIKYLQELEVLGLHFKYISVKKWNPYNLAPNMNFKVTNIGTGHCVVLTFILNHIICSQQIEPIEAYKLLSKLDDGELLLVISGYTLGLCTLLDL